MKVISAALIVAVSLGGLVSLSNAATYGPSTFLVGACCAMVLFFGLKGWILAMNQPE